MKNVILFFVLSFTACTTMAQIRRIDSQMNLWGIYTGTFKLVNNTHFYSEYQHRRADLGEDLQQHLIRFGFEQRFKSPVSVTAGYAFVITYPYGKQPVATEFNEHRIWQQVNFTQVITKFKFTHRFRLEQRWLEKKRFESSSNEYVFNGYNYLNRIRYRFFASYSIWKKESENKFNELQLQCSDEVFIAFGKNVLLNVFDQNRVSCALSFSFNKHVSVFGGYLNQYLLKASGILAENNHTLQLGVNLVY